MHNKNFNEPYKQPKEPMGIKKWFLVLLLMNLWSHFIFKVQLSALTNN